MKIKTKLHIIAVLSLAAALIIGLILFFSARQVNEAIKKDRAADEIIRGFFELSILTNEYLMYHEERAKTQWQLKHDSIKRFLEEVEVKSPEKMVLLKRIRESHMDIKNIFSEMVSNYEGYRDEKGGVSQELNEMLVGNLGMKSRSMVSDAYQLAEISSARLIGSQQRAYLLVLLFSLIMAVLVATVSFLIHRGVVKPIGKLHEGTEIIGAGNLSYKVGTMAKDEVGQLSRAFDRMTIALKESFGGLEKEVDERKRAETHIRKLNRVYSVLSDINQAIVRVREPRVLFEKACSIAVEKGGFRMAWIGLLDESSQKIEVIAHVGEAYAYFEKLDISLRGNPVSYCPIDCALREKQHAICNIIPNDAHMAECQKTASRLGFRSSASFPLIVSGRIRGTFNLYAGEPDFYDEEELKLLDELAMDISFAMEFNEKETEREGAEKALQESEKKCRQVIENATEIIYTVDEKGNFTYANPAGLKVTGYSLEDLRKLNYADLVLPEHREKVMEIYINQLRQRIPTTHVEFPFINKAGGITWFSQNATLVTEEGKILGFHIIARDITERKQAEEALRDSEKRYRLLAENVTDVIWTADMSIRYTYVSPSVTRMRGYSVQEAMSQTVEETLTPSSFEAAMKVLAEELAKEQLDNKDLFRSRTLELEENCKDGSTVWTESTITFLRELDGRPVGILGITRDITERKKAEEALRWSEETARALLNATTDSVFLIDSGGSVLALNEMAAKRLNTRVDEMLGACLYDFLPSDLAKMRKTRFDEVFRTGKPAYFEDERQGIWFDNCVYPISDVSGKVMKLAIYGRDVTEQKRAEEALQKSEEKYRTILETIEEGYYEVDLTGNFTFFNDSLCRMLGYTKDELMGMNNRQYMDKETAEKVYQVFKRLYATEEPYEAFDWEITRKDGTKRFHDSSVSLIRNAKGECIGFRGIARDVTERKQAEERLRLQGAALNAAANAIIITNCEGMIEWANPAFAVLTGYSHTEVVGKNPRQLVKSDKQDQAFYKNLWNTILGGEVWHGQIINCRKDGSLYTEEMTITPLRSERGEISRFIAIKQDITEHKRAEEAVIASEERYRTLFEGAAEGILVADIEGKQFKYANPAICRMLGYTAEELTRLRVADIHPKEALDRVAADFEAQARGEKTLVTEIPCLRKEGSLIYVNIATAPVVIDGRQHNVGFFTDVTQHRRSEQALRESEERFRELYDRAPVGYHEYDSEGRITRVNRTDLDMLGYTAEEMIGQYIWKFNVEEEIVRQQVLEKLSGLRPPGRGLERAYKRKNGTTLAVLIEDRLIRNENGRIRGIRCTIQDITDRKRAEENLKQSEENARQLAQENAIMAEIGRIISSTLNIDEVYERFAEEMKKIISFDRVLINHINIEKGTVRNVYIAGKELRDRNVKDIYPLEGSGNAEMVRTRSTFLIQTEDFNEYKDRFPMLLSTFQAGFRSIMNVPLFSKGKVIGGLLLRSHKPYAYTDNNVRLAERIASQIAGAVANAQLYAERIQAEQEREALQEQLRQSQKMEAIGQLAGGVAHDFNNLLTVMKGYSQLSLAEMKKDDPSRENIEEIIKASDRAADLTRQLLAFSRRQIMEMKVLDLNDSLRSLDKMLRRVIGEDIELGTLLEKDIGRVKGDPGQIEQMVMNLVVNARDAMLNGGKLTIETANVELDQAYARAHVAVTPGRYVMISVSDTGVGMAPEVRDRVFEPFFTTKEKGKGTGLGLSTVYGIVKQSGGNIWVYSELGLGTTFKIYLPRVEEPFEVMREKVTTEEFPPGNETILVVEDEEDVRRLAVRALERQGYRVLEASCGDDALVLSKEPIRLVLTDVVMPGMSGRQLADRLIPLYPKMKVLYMSGYTDNAIVHHGVLEEGVNYIQKPFTIDKLVRKVREILDKDLKHVV